MVKKRIFTSILTLSLLLGISCICCSRFSNKINNTTTLTKQKNTTTPVEEKYYDSVAIIQTTPGNLGYAPKLATGFAIDPNHILTVGHFCLDVAFEQKLYRAAKNIMTLKSNEKGLLKPAINSTILAFDEKKDICLLSSPAHGMTPLPLAETIAPLTVEDKITIIGAPHGFFPVRRDGRIISSLAYRFAPYDDMLFLAVNIQKGSSGSPVIKDGSVIGMIAVVPFHIDETALAVPIDDIRKFLDKNMIK